MQNPIVYLVGSSVKGIATQTFVVEKGDSNNDPEMLYLEIGRKCVSGRIQRHSNAAKLL